MMKKIENQENSALKAAHARYEKKRKVKLVSFNEDTEADLLAFANSLPDFSNAVKNWLREQMNKK